MPELENSEFDKMVDNQTDSCSPKESNMEKAVESTGRIELYAKQDLNTYDLEKHYKRVHCKLRHNIFFWAVIIVSIIFTVIVLIYFWHLLTPWRWLMPEELENIKHLAMSICVGVAANFVSGYFKH